MLKKKKKEQTFDATFVTGNTIPFILYFSNLV